MNKIYITLIAVFTVLFSAESQVAMDSQNTIEKVYMHTDRSFYFPGETVWFKAYITNSCEEVTNLSDIVYAELIAPNGSLVETLNYKIENGFAFGQFEIKPNWIGGIYSIKGFTNWMRNFDDEAFFEKKITIQKVIAPRLQMKADFDREAYGPSSKVSWEVSMKDLENNPLAFKNANISIKIDGEKVFDSPITSNKNGVYKVDYELAPGLNTTDVLFNLQLSHNGQTESISRSVPVILDNIDLQFMSESGILLANYPNQIAYKAVNSFGKPADIEGYITNELGAKVAEFTSFHDGMGSITLTPGKSTKYLAHITKPFDSKIEYQLPKVIEKGVSIHLANHDNEIVELELYSNESRAVTIKVSDIKKSLTKQSISIKKGLNFYQFNTRDFPKGILKISVLDNKSDLRAERLIFANYKRELNIEIQTDKTSYSNREKVDVFIRTLNSKNEPVPSNLSLAIVDNKILSFADDRQDHITSYLLMSSELNGTINKPIFYFDKEEEKAIVALDLVMLTHGWRSFYTESNISIISANFPPDQNSIQTGIVTNSKGEPTKAKLLLFENGTNKVLPFETNDEGGFVFKTDEGSTYSMLAYNDAKEKLTIISDKMHLERGLKERDKRRRALENRTKKRKDAMIQLLIPGKKATKVRVQEKVGISMNEDPSALDEVVVTAQGIKKEAKALGYAVSVIKSQEVEGDVARLLSGKSSGIQITSQSGTSGTGANVIIRGYNSISGNNRPLFVIDGIPITGGSKTGKESFVDIQPSDIASVNVLKGLAAATLYGTEGRNGVIIIRTKNDAYFKRFKSKTLNNVKYNNYAYKVFGSYRSPSNYSKQMAFYVPRYDLTPKEEEMERTDFRNTIYWNPVVQTDKNGIATLSYYNSDANTSFKIIAEGISALGEVGRMEKEYSVQSEVDIDFKIPPYLSLDDEVEISVIIKNNSDAAILGELSLMLPDGIIELNKDNLREFSIEANSFAKKSILVKPIAVNEDASIKTLFNWGDKNVFVSRNATIVNPYFPTEVSLSGATAKQFKFQIEDVVENSLEANFKLYTDVIGEVMDGVESLIRKPSGCFEQTSSSTYPNVMVLQYLRESAKSNPAIEKKALDFIASGYKRLVSFETSRGGFEWFGNTPPHETLTAFGILEFTEMKEVYPKVDDEMIERTLDWLLGRKDGKGGFKKSTKGYDSFRSSPADVANAYIVYALSEAGVVQDKFEFEYQTALKESLSSNDSYKMAMMALAAANLNKKEDAQMLRTRLQTNIDVYGLGKLPVSNTITRSYGNSKMIETLAFNILAMLKSENANAFLISEMIKKLVSLREHGRFGATQSTAMALKALIEYTKTQKEKFEKDNDEMIIAINGETITKKLISNTEGYVSLQGLEKYLVQGPNKVTVSFSKAKILLPYSLNIKWFRKVPVTAKDCPLFLDTQLNSKSTTIGNTIRMNTSVTNKNSEGLGMVTAIIGIPAGLSTQPWQLKELMEKNKIAYYEIFENYVVFYWRSFAPKDRKEVLLDLKVENSGQFVAPASSAYLYYGEEYKHWLPGESIEIVQ